jgi:hypothetical protein
MTACLPVSMDANNDQIHFQSRLGAKKGKSFSPWHTDSGKMEKGKNSRHSQVRIPSSFPEI